MISEYWDELIVILIVIAIGIGKEEGNWSAVWGWGYGVEEEWLGEVVWIEKEAIIVPCARYPRDVDRIDMFRSRWGVGSGSGDREARWRVCRVVGMEMEMEILGVRVRELKTEMKRVLRV